MTTSITSLIRKKCELIPAAKIAAYTDLRLDPDNPTGIILDTSWDEVHLDIKDLIKAGETITHLYLAPKTGDPLGLCYEREDGQTEYIPGDELSRIISLHLLKDVDQSTPPSDGIVYMYDETTNLFKPFDLKTFVANTNTHLSQLDGAITNLQNQINALDGRISAIENAIYNWTSDKNTKIPRGNINVTSGGYNSGNGIYTRAVNTNEDLNFE